MIGNEDICCSNPENCYQNNIFPVICVRVLHLLLEILPTNDVRLIFRLVLLWPHSFIRSLVSNIVYNIKDH